MSPERITVRFTVPLNDEASSDSGPVVFTHWLPIGQELGLSFTHEGCSGVLWFEMQSAPFNDDEASIARTVNVLVQTILAEVADAVDADLAAWMQQRNCRDAPAADDERLATRCEQHGLRVLASLEHGLNRFLSFVRIEKGQHWVRPIMLDGRRLSSHAIRFGAKARIGDGDWFRWCPAHGITLTGHVPDPNDPRFVTSQDWRTAQEFVGSRRKPTLTLELLAGAEALATDGSDRAALTEAVAALEVALAGFTRTAKLESLLPSPIRTRLALSSLSSLSDRMGLTGSVAILLPFLLPEDELPSDLLTACRDAISQRQNVVHHGQRSVMPATLAKQIAALRRLSELLLRHSADVAE